MVRHSLENLSHPADRNVKKDVPSPSEHLVAENVVEKNFVEVPDDTMNVVIVAAKKSSKKREVNSQDEVVLSSLLFTKKKNDVKGKKNKKKVMKKNFVKKTRVVESPVEDVEQVVADIIGDIEE